MTRTLPSYLQTCLLALVTLALLTVPFAHRAGAAPVTPQMTQFLAMGGNLADICGESSGHINAGCESCRIMGTMVLPPHAQMAKPVSFPTLFLGELNARSDAHLEFYYTHPPVRGPPQI